MNGFHSSGIDTIGKDTYALVALEAPEQETGSLTRSGASGARRRGAGRGRWRLSGPVGGVKMGPGRLVAHVRSMRDNASYRASFTSEITPLIHPYGDPHDHRRQRPADRPPPTRRAPALRAADQGVADALESAPLRQHQARLRRPVAHLHRLV